MAQDIFSQEGIPGKTDAVRCADDDVVEGMPRQMVNREGYAAERHRSILRLDDAVNRAALLGVDGNLFLLRSSEIIGVPFQRRLGGDQPGFAKRHSQWNLEGFAQALAVSMMVDMRVGNDQPRRGQSGVFQSADQLVIFL